MVRYLLLLSGISLFTTATLAQTFPASAPATAPETAFTEGTWNAVAYGNFGSDVTNRNVRLGGANMGVGYYVVDNVSLNLEGSACLVDQAGPDGWGGTLSLLLRQHFINRGRFSFYIDVGWGVIETEYDTPLRGTRFNYIQHVGPGITYEPDKGTYLLGGARFFHISNAREEGRDRNPSVNGLEGYLGLMIKF